MFQLAEQILDNFWNTRTQLEKVNRLRIALTRFFIPLLPEIEGPISKRFRQCGKNPERELIHVRSEEVQKCLKDPTVDFSLGGIVTGQQVDKKIEFLPWRTEEFVLLSNFPLNRSKIHIDELRSLCLPIILPNVGITKEFVDRAFGNLEGLNVVERCNDMQFGIDLLRLKVHEAFIITPRYVAEEAMKRQGTAKVFKTHPLAGCDLRFHVGLFRRAGEDSLYDSTHPVRLFWETFKSLASDFGRES